MCARFTPMKLKSLRNWLDYIQTNTQSYFQPQQFLVAKLSQRGKYTIYYIHSSNMLI